MKQPHPQVFLGAADLDHMEDTLGRLCAVLDDAMPFKDCAGPGKCACLRNAAMALHVVKTLRVRLSLISGAKGTIFETVTVPNGPQELLG